jgi:hypothetical protein
MPVNFRPFRATGDSVFGGRFAEFDGEVYNFVIFHRLRIVLEADNERKNKDCYFNIVIFTY